MNSEEKTRVTVDIYGIQYKLVGNSSASYMKMVAAHVNDQMHRIAGGNSRLDTPRLAVLAAVNMADEYFKLQKELEEARKALAEHHAVKERCRELEQQNEKLRGECEAAIERNLERQDEVRRLTEKCSELERECEKLRGEYDAEAERSREQLEEARQLTERCRELQEQIEKQRAEYAAELERVREKLRQSQTVRDEYRKLQEEYAKLQEEYAKLQSEFNEWIELVERDSP